ncbi:hypothetical protein AUJ10_01650 [Candidatus Pacearchaeota archaeon CG1_02_31_27]|nr:MAG: hypothetical protein AUJ10_01650 [Candidatus Pacearchaeota archaeon CG1_02_31_27]PIN92616.1 MAG: hypothetical protein COU55_00360 [Candidatus Pacearchaeota archaeon CG10_big_fil_rev_8_21_14_0_10_31_59]PIZ81200.1 MAG: hypothetical protein COX99_00435 [Candidatus Pacearchaeota archaeon CG_4_10_14_0_2_um_filter_31_10]
MPLNKKRVLIASIFLILVVVIIILAVNPKPTGNVIKNLNERETGVVTKIIDGDTVIVKGESVRLLGIDTDEQGYPCYEQAKLRLEELVLSKEVELEQDVEDKDQYGRYLRYIFLDGENINLKMVEEGLAVARFSSENKNYKEEILKAEENAMQNKIGCKWSGSSQLSEYSSSTTETENEEILDPNIIRACSASDFIGQEKTVQGKIVDVYKSKTNTVFINFEKPYPNTCFTAVIFSSDLSKFPSEIENYFEDKTVKITGKIKEYNGKPEIILDEPSQIEIVK